MLFSTLVWSQDVAPFPYAITDRVFYPQSSMMPPDVNESCTDPDLGGTMIRVTDENTDAQEPGSFFFNPPNQANEWNADNSKFFVESENHRLAFAFDSDTGTVSALPGAVGEHGFPVPLRTATFSFIDPDLMYGTEGKSPLVIATYRFSTGVVQPLYDTTNCGTQPPMVAGPHIFSVDTTISADDNRVVITAGGPSAASEPFVIVYDKTLGCRWYNTETGQVGGQWGPGRNGDNCRSVLDEPLLYLRKRPVCKDRPNAHRVLCLECKLARYISL